MIPREEQFKALNLLVLLLPVEHRNTFRLILQFCINVTQHEKNNRMGVHNVAMVTAPTFFSPRLFLPKFAVHELSFVFLFKDILFRANGKFNVKPKTMTREELLRYINGAAVCCCIVELMLQSGDSLWMVPADLAGQAKEAHSRRHLGKIVCNLLCLNPTQLIVVKVLIALLVFAD